METLRLETGIGNRANDFQGGQKKYLVMKEGAMNGKAECVGQRDDQTAKNTYPNLCGSHIRAGSVAADLARIAESVRASVASRPGEYNARRLRSQREIIRDVMISAADCETWLTLGELRALTRYGEASISAQLRHLRKAEYGGYGVAKRHRDGATPERLGTDGRGEGVWEYRITREMRGIEPCRTNSGRVGAVA